MNRRERRVHNEIVFRDSARHVVVEKTGPGEALAAHADPRQSG